MAYLSTEVTEIGEYNEEICDYLKKLNILETENQQILRKYRELKNSSELKIEELSIENESLRRTVNSLEEFLKRLKDPKGDNDQMLNRILTLESDLVKSQQSEQNLIRKVQTMNTEIIELRVKIDMGLLSNTAKSKGYSPYSHLQDINELSQDSLGMIKEFLADYNEIKEELSKLRENSLVMITEKELSNINLRDKMDLLKQKENEEISKLTMENQLLRSKLKEKEQNSSFEEGEIEKFVLTYDEQNELIDKFTKSEEENERLLKEIQTKDELYSYEKLKLEENIDKLLIDHHNEICELKSINEKLRMELYQRKDFDGMKEESSEGSNELLIKEIERLQNLIDQNEELRERNEIKLNESLKELSNEIKHFQNQVFNLKEENGKLIRENQRLINCNDRLLKDMNEKLKEEHNTKELELQQLRDIIENIGTENDIIKFENENLKRNLEVSKNDFISFQNEIKKIKDSNEKNRRKMEQKYQEIEKKYDNEKRRASVSFKVNESVTLKEILDASPTKKIREEDSSTDFNIKNELESKNQKIEELEKMIAIITKENTLLKESLQENLEVYETQIKLLQRKEIKLNQEIQIKRRSSQKLPEIEKSNDISNLAAENIFLKERVNILLQELKKLKETFEKSLKNLKKEIDLAEESLINNKISLASLSFEKESEIIKYKNIIRKMKQTKK